MTRYLRFKFSLRTLVAALTVCAIGLGWFADRLHRREAAIATINAAGGSVSTEYGARQLMASMLCPSPGVPRPPVVRSWSERVLGDSFKHVNLCDQSLSTQEIQALAALHEVRGLSLFGTDLNDRGLAALRGLRRLESLNLNGCAITNESAAYLAGFPELKWLELEDTQISDGAVGYLAKLKNLEVLRVRGTAITDGGLSQFSSLTNLHELAYGDSERKQMLITTACIDELKRALPACNFCGISRDK